MSINEKAWLNIRDIIAQAKWEQVRDYINRYEAAKATHQPVSTHTCTAPHETEAETVKYIESFAEQPDESPYKAFFDALWRAYCDQELQFEDANFIITAACKNGLAKEEKYDPNVHGEALGGEWGLEEGDSCYILAKQPKREISDELIWKAAAAWETIRYPEHECVACDGSGREADCTPCSNPNERAKCRECNGKGYWVKEPSKFDRMKAALNMIAASGRND